MGVVEGAVAEHREEHVGSSPREAEEGLGVMLSLSDLLLVVGPRDQVGQGRKRGQEEGPFELLVFPARGLFAAEGNGGSAATPRRTSS